MTTNMSSMDKMTNVSLQALPTRASVRSSNVPFITEEVKSWSMVSTHVKQLVNDYFARQWYDHKSAPIGPSKRGRNKLRTYAQFKITLVQELYVSEILKRNHRSALAKFRLGFAPIRLKQVDMRAYLQLMCLVPNRNRK